MAGEWKTIDQREQSQRRARRSRRRGVAAVSAGAGLVTAMEVARPGLTRVHLKALRALHGREARAKVHPMIRRDLHLEMYRREPKGAVQAGGAALAVAGGVGMAQGRAREAYQQSRINARRRARLTKSVDGDRTSAINRMGGAYRGRRTPSEEARAMGDLTDRFRRKPGAHVYQARVSTAVATRLARVAKTQRAGGLREQARFGAGGVSGRRIIEKSAAPKGPSIRKPTIARAGGAQPKTGLVTAGARPPVATQPQAPVLARAPITGIVPMSGPARTIGKADRYFDPEDRRQRRRGVAVGTLGAGGGYLTATGGTQAVRHVRAQNNPQFRGGMKHVASHLAPGTDRRVRNVVQAVTDRKATVIHHGTTARLAGGAALLGAAGLVARGSDDPRKRRWT